MRSDDLATLVLYRGQFGCEHLSCLQVLASMSHTALWWSVIQYHGKMPFAVVTAGAHVHEPLPILRNNEKKRYSSEEILPAHSFTLSSYSEFTSSFTYREA